MKSSYESYRGKEKVSANAPYPPLLREVSAPPFLKGDTGGFVVAPVLPCTDRNDTFWPLLTEKLLVCSTGRCQTSAAENSLFGYSYVSQVQNIQPAGIKCPDRVIRAVHDWLTIKIKARVQHNGDSGFLFKMSQ